MIWLITFNLVIFGMHLHLISALPSHSRYSHRPKVAPGTSLGGANSKKHCLLQLEDTLLEACPYPVPFSFQVYERITLPGSLAVVEGHVIGSEQLVVSRSDVACHFQGEALISWFEIF